MVGEIPANPSVLGDVILARKDVGTSYHLAVTVDDADQGSRFGNTRRRPLPRQPSPSIAAGTPRDCRTPKWEHHPLVLDERRQKVCEKKSVGNASAASEKHWHDTGTKSASSWDYSVNRSALSPLSTRSKSGSFSAWTCPCRISQSMTSHARFQSRSDNQTVESSMTFVGRH